MAIYDFDIGIIGGGSAGLTVASGAAQFGAKTLLIDREKRLGGDCLHYGCVPSKTLIKIAAVYHFMKNSKKFGLPQVKILPVDFRIISDRIRSVIEIIQRHDSPDRFRKLGARVESGEAKFIDEYAIRLNGRIYSARNWVIATGSSPAIPPIKGLDKISYITNREIFYLETLPSSMIIIGGGPISTEMAQAFSRLGTKVIVIQRGSQILNREDKDMADAVMNRLEEEGVTFYLNSEVINIKEIGNKCEVIIKKNDGNIENLTGDKILIAVGRRANLEGLGLENIGIDYDSHGLKLDTRLRTTHKHIYGAGDVTGNYQFTHAAGYEGGIVLTNAILHLPRRVNYTCFPWCTYTYPELANIGMNEKSAKRANIEYHVWSEEFSMNDRSLAEGESTGKIKLILDKRGKPIGVQILGIHAGELIGEWIATMNGKVKLSTLIRAVHPYPTLGEINKQVVGNYYSGKIFSKKIKKILRFLFHLRGNF